MTFSEKAAFIERDLIPYLKQIPTDAPALWGKMSFQHMVEHLVLVFKNANGKIKTDHVLTPEDKLPAFREFLRGDKEFRENTKSPALQEDVYPLRLPDAATAIAKLETEIADFFKAYSNDKELLIRNPVFGDLNYEDAVLLLYKHALHHLKQFGMTFRALY